MHRIGIITDTNSGMTAREAEAAGIILIPMPFSVDGQEYVENVTMDQETFFERLSKGAAVATSQPSPDMLLSCWEEALKTFSTLIYIPMSSALSSSCQSAAMLARDFDGRVIVVDNRRISITQKQSALDAALWRAKGMPANEIVRNLMVTAMDASIYLTVDDLQYLKRGGRITPSVAAIGSVLNIKPVLQIQGGKLDTYRKVRGLKMAQSTMLDAIARDLENRFHGMSMLLRTAWTGDLAFGEAWTAHVQARFPDYTVTGDPLPISIACHVGPGVTALGLIRKVK